MISYLNDLGNNCGVASVNGFSIEEYITYLEKQKEQKPAEWSEEDKFKLEDAITGIDVGIGFYETEGKHPNLLKAIIEAKEWLKSLKPQPKQDWIKEQTKKQ